MAFWKIDADLYNCQGCTSLKQYIHAWATHIIFQKVSQEGPNGPLVLASTIRAHSCEQGLCAKTAKCDTNYLGFHFFRTNFVVYDKANVSGIDSLSLNVANFIYTWQLMIWHWWSQKVWIGLSFGSKNFYFEIKYSRPVIEQNIKNWWDKNSSHLSKKMMFSFIPQVRRTLSSWCIRPRSPVKKRRPW